MPRRRSERFDLILGLISVSGLVIVGSGVVLGQRLPIKTYTTADGLAHNTVNRIVRDSRGFLWFCTDDGLSRFDGYRFTNYGTDQGLPHGQVNDVLETREGEYWDRRMRSASFLAVLVGQSLRYSPERSPSVTAAYIGGD